MFIAKILTGFRFLTSVLEVFLQLRLSWNSVWLYYNEKRHKSFETSTHKFRAQIESSGSQKVARLNNFSIPKKYLVILGFRIRIFRDRFFVEIFKSGPTYFLGMFLDRDFCDIALGIFLGWLNRDQAETKNPNLWASGFRKKSNREGKSCYLCLILNFRKQIIYFY